MPHAPNSMEITADPTIIHVSVCIYIYAYIH